MARRLKFNSHARKRREANGFRWSLNWNPHRARFETFRNGIIDEVIEPKVVESEEIEAVMCVKNGVSFGFAPLGFAGGISDG